MKAIIENFTSGAYNYDLIVKENSSYTLNFAANSQGNLFVKVSGQGKLKLELNLENDANWSILLLNQSQENIETQEIINVYQNTHLDLNYGEFAHAKQDKDTILNLVGEHSHIDFNAAVLNEEALKWHILAHHQAQYSFADVTTHAIVLENCKLDLDVIGKIDNGYSGSETHQTSRIMNLGDGLETIVHPQLLIEENDVAASHAATVGQPNPEHLYYLQSRGMTYDQAMRLMVLGYLMPLIQSIKNEDIQEKLKAEVETKVFGL